MSTSGSADFAISRDTIIKRALRLLSVLPSGASPSVNQSSDAQYALNTLVKAWMADGLSLWAIKSYTLPLVAGTSSYRFGESQIINTPKPL